MRFYLCIVLLAAMVSACNNNKTSKSDATAGDLEKAIQQAEARRDGSKAGANKCLVAYQEKYDELLSDEEVLSATGFPKQVMTTKYNKIMQPEHHAYTWKFTNRRRGKIKGIPQEMELPDIISVHSIKAMSADQFIKSYRAASAEEMQAAKDALNEMTGDDKQNATERKTKQAAGSSMLNTFSEIAQAWEPVAGIGDQAHWNRETRDLAVLKNGVKFEVKADVSSDNEKNKGIATQLARIILAQCN